jgi:hypothetical protein
MIWQFYVPGCVVLDAGHEKEIQYSEIYSLSQWSGCMHLERAFARLLDRICVPTQLRPPAHKAAGNSTMQRRKRLRVAKLARILSTIMDW